MRAKEAGGNCAQSKNPYFRENPKLRLKRLSLETPYVRTYILIIAIASGGYDDQLIAGATRLPTLRGH